MIYKTVPGTILTSLCDQYFLVSAMYTDNENSNCVNQINETGAFIWQLMQNGISYEEIIHQVKKEYQVEDRDDLNTMIDQYINQLKSLHYLKEE